jgi:disulfide bond formation protein DsbB
VPFADELKRKRSECFMLTIIMKPVSFVGFFVLIATLGLVFFERTKKY